MTHSVCTVIELKRQSQSLWAIAIELASVQPGLDALARFPWPPVSPTNATAAAIVVILELWSVADDCKRPPRTYPPMPPLSFATYFTTYFTTDFISVPAGARACGRARWGPTPCNKLILCRQLGLVRVRVGGEVVITWQTRLSLINQYCSKLLLCVTS